MPVDEVANDLIAPTHIVGVTAATGGNAGLIPIGDLRGALSAKDGAYGAVGDGTTDDSDALEAALRAGPVCLPAGQYRITRPLGAFTHLSLAGPAPADTLDTQGDERLATILCHEVDGYVFDIDGGTGITIENVFFDGRLPSVGTYAPDWLGLFHISSVTDVPPTGGAYGIRLEGVRVSYTDAVTSLVSLRGCFWVHINGCRFGHVPNGSCILFGMPVQDETNTGVISTTITIQKTYMHYARQCVVNEKNNGHTSFNECVFESSIVAGTWYSTSVAFNNCHFENIGYDLYGSRFSGIINKNFGLAGLTSGLNTPVISAFNFCRSNVSFLHCQISTRNSTFRAAVPLAGWIFMMGTGGGAQHRGGEARFISCAMPIVHAEPFFEVDANADHGACFIEWQNGATRSALNYDDIRTINAGRLYLKLGDDAIFEELAFCEIVHKRFTMSRDAAPTCVPLNGAWVPGDKIIYETPTAGGDIGEIYTADGWKPYGAIDA